MSMSILEGIAERWFNNPDAQNAFIGALTDIASGNPKVVLIFGPQGCGKDRFLDLFCPSCKNFLTVNGSKVLESKGKIRVIEVKGDIPLDLVEQEKDQVWAAVKTLGEKCRD